MSFRLRFFGKSQEKEPLLLKTKNISSQEKIEHAYKKTQAFRETAKKLADALFELFRAMNEKKSELSWFSRHLCYHPWFSISYRLTKIKKLSQALNQHTSSYKQFMETAIAELKKAPSKALADFVQPLHRTLDEVLDDPFRGAKVLCEPTYFLEQVEQKTKYSMGSDIKLLALAKGDKHKLDELLINLVQEKLSEDEVIGELYEGIYPAINDIAPDCKLKLNETLFSVAHMLFKTKEEHYSGLLQQLDTVGGHAMEPLCPPYETTRCTR